LKDLFPKVFGNLKLAIITACSPGVLSWQKEDLGKKEIAPISKQTKNRICLNLLMIL